MIFACFTQIYDLNTKYSKIIINAAVAVTVQYLLLLLYIVSY